MKTFRINLPTSYSEFKSLLKVRSDKRYRHNTVVLNKFAYDVIREIKRDYWNKEISDAMRNKLCNKITEMLYIAKHNLK